MTAKRRERSTSGRPHRPIRAAVLRGLTVMAPPLLTIVIFVWIASTIQEYVLEPTRVFARAPLAAPGQGRAATRAQAVRAPPAPSLQNGSHTFPVTNEK